MAPIPELLDRFDRQPAEIRAAVRGLDAAEISSFPVPGKWSIQQLVIHLSDAEASFADRMRRLIAEEHPILLAWDEKRFIDRLMYDQQSVEDAVTLIELTRRQLGRVLRRLSPDGFARTGQHSQRGRQTLAEVLAFDVNHMAHHLMFLHEKRSRLGK